MWPFILVILIIFLVAIILSICAYPFICASIAIASKEYKTIVTGILLSLTLVVYIFACTILEKAIDNWCYSLYAGIVVTPVVLFICTGLDNPKGWPENGENIHHHNLYIPLMSLMASLSFTIEGFLRMLCLNSAYMLLNKDYDWYYFHNFVYVGILLFFVSIISVFIIGITTYNRYSSDKRILKAELERKAQIEYEINDVTSKLKKDCELLSSYLMRTQNDCNLISNYNDFCRAFITALQSSDEISIISHEYGYFNDINMDCKILMIRNLRKKYYLYPTGIVEVEMKDAYKYLPLESTTVTIHKSQISKKYPIPGDIRPIRQFWMHTCRDGSPDLRYHYNPATYIYEYRTLSFDDIILFISRIEVAEAAMSAYNKYYNQIHKVMAQQHYEKSHIHETIEQADVRKEEVKESLEVLKAINPVKDVKKEIEQNILNSNIPTLEGCFRDIISKHGNVAFNDHTLVSIIKTQYKKVDITDYNDILEKMEKMDFFCQFVNPDKQNDFYMYNISSSFAHKYKFNVQKCLFVTQALVSALKNK